MPRELCELADRVPGMKTLHAEDLAHIEGCEDCQNTLVVMAAVRSIPEDHWISKFEPETPECPPPELIMAFTCWELSPAQARQVRRHLGRCPRCCRAAFVLGEEVRVAGQNCALS